MGESQAERPGVGVAALVRHGDRILLVRRRYRGAGLWGAPGGYLDHGETLEACATRETREETKVVIGPPRFLCVTNDRYADGKHNVTVWFAAATSDPEAATVATGEATEVAWFPRDALPDDLYESTRRALSGDSLPADAIPRWLFGAG